MPPSAEPAPLLEVEGLGKSHGAVKVIDGLDFTVTPREWVALVGPSGCGKSTLLSIVGGHESTTCGRVSLRGRARTVFQRDALFPWLSVEANIALALGHLAPVPAKERVEALLGITGLQAFRSHLPHEISGGMKQRVQLAWALGAEADLLLLDEPFSALDALNRLRMQDELVRLFADTGAGVLLVTHDVQEAARLADRVLVLSPAPARILADVVVRGPRPRDPLDPGVRDAAAGILGLLRL